MKSTELIHNPDGTFTVVRGKKAEIVKIGEIRDYIRDQIEEEKMMPKDRVSSTQLNPLSVLAARIESMEYVLLQGGSGLEIYDPKREAFLPVISTEVVKGTTTVALHCPELTLMAEFDSLEQAMAVRNAVWEIDHPNPGVAAAIYATTKFVKA